jgi:hypothetical protein
MLFKHVTRDITFVLVVGDFGVKFDILSDYKHLVDSLKELQNVTEDSVGKRPLFPWFWHWL